MVWVRVGQRCAQLQESIRSEYRYVWTPSTPAACPNVPGCPSRPERASVCRCVLKGPF